MAAQILPVFPYTRFDFEHIANFDGTRYSVCLRCYRTVASSHNEYSLEQAESTHLCAPHDAVRKPGSSPLRLK